MRSALPAVIALAFVAPVSADVPAAPAGVGTAGPASVATSARDGSWVLLCQARRDTDHDGSISVRSGFNGTYGDEQQAYLVIGSGPGEQIDDITSIDPGGERIIVNRKHRILLLHPGKEPPVDLTAIGGASFANDHELAYTKSVGKATHLVVRDIATRHEREIDLGPGEIYTWYVSGAWIEVQVLEHKKGDKPWVVHEDHAPHWCWTGALSDVVTSEGTPPVRRWVPLAGGKPRGGDDIIGALGDQLVRRMPDRAIALEAADGARKELVPASCNGTIMSADEAQQSVVVACKDGALFEYGSGKPRAIGLHLTPPDGDWLRPGRFLYVRGKDGGSIVVDTQTGTMRETGQYQNEIENKGGRAFVQRGEKLVVIDAAGDHELGAIETYPETIQLGHYLYVQPLLVDTETGKLVGQAPTRDGHQANVKAIANDGRMLVGFGGGRYDMTPGPLEWVQATPGTGP